MPFYIPHPPVLAAVLGLQIAVEPLVLNLRAGQTPIIAAAVVLVVAAVLARQGAVQLPVGATTATTSVVVVAMSQGCER